MSDLDEPPLILLVGHCAPDSAMLRGAVQRALPEARVQRINDQRALEAAAPAASVLLINRVLDGDFPAHSGLDLLTGLLPSPASLVLISDRPEAQHQAERLGALPGFGKAALHSRETRQRLIDAVARARAQRPPEPATPPRP